MPITVRIPLVRSPYLDPVPELATIDPSAVVLQPADHESWDQMFMAHEDALDYLLTPGDYRSWGRVAESGKALPRGTATRRRTIRFHHPAGPSPHPVRRAEQVIIDDGDFWDAAYVIFHGLTFRPTKDTQSTFSVRPGASHLVIDQCLFEDHFISGVNFWGSFNTLQRSVVRNADITAGRDTWGVMTSLQRGVENIGSRIVDNEIYNHVDQLGATVSSKPGTAFSEMRDCVVDGNDCYNTDDYIATSNAMENLLDFKIGSDEPARNIVTNNRFWGLAESTGGSGGSNHSLLFHRAARNWAVADNIIGENASPDAAIYESVWQTKDVDPTEVFRERGNRYWRNIIYAHSRALGVTLDGHAEGNIVIDAQHLLFRSSAGGRKCPTDAVVRDTRMSGGGTVEDPNTAEALSTYDPTENTAAPPALIQYQRRRWTGPEWVTILT